MNWNILIIDDDEQVLSTIKSMLKMKFPDCNCISFSIVDEFLYSYIKTNNIDLTICDVKIPNTDISNLAKDLYLYTKSVILFISGYNYTLEFFNDILEDNCIYDFMEKPFSLEGFTSRISALLNVSSSSKKANKKLFETMGNLHKTQNKFWAVTENSSDVTIILSKQGRVKYTSPSINKFSNNIEKIHGMHYKDFCSPSNSYSKFDEAFNQCVSNPKKPSLINNISIKTDEITIKTFDCRLTNMLNIKGVEGIIVNSRETSMESTLRNSIWNIFNYLNFIVILLDENMKIVLANHYLSQFLGYKSEFDLIGVDWNLFLPQEEKKIVNHVHKKTLEENTSLDYSEFMNNIIDKDGKIIEVRWFNCPIINGITGTFSIGITGNQLESVESIRAYWRDIIQKDKTTIRAMKSMFIEKEQERKTEC